MLFEEPDRSVLRASGDIDSGFGIDRERAAHVPPFGPLGSQTAAAKTGRSKSSPQRGSWRSMRSGR